MPNLKRLSLTILILLIVATVVHAVHVVQIGRSVALLRQQVELARKTGDPAQLIAAMKRYLHVRPDDVELQMEKLDLQAEHARSDEDVLDVYYDYQELLRRRPEDAERRERIIAFGLRLKEYQDVLTNIAFLESRIEKTPQLLLWKATAQQHTGDTEGAIKSYREAIELDPALIAAYVELATILRKNLDAHEESNYWIQRLTEVNASSSEAFLAQSRFYLDNGDLHAAMTSVERALALAEHRSEAVLLWSDVTSAIYQQESVPSERSWKDRDEEMAQRLRQAWEEDPAESRFASKLASLALRREAPDEAERILRLGLERSPSDPLLQWELADLAITQGRFDEAQKLITELTASGASRGLIDYLRGRILIHEHQWSQAAAALQRSLNDVAASPRLLAQAEMYLSNCHAELGDSDQRLNCCRRAVNAQPFLVAAREHLARALLAVGRVDEALAEYRTMIDLPDAPAFGWTADVGWAAVAKVLIIRNLSAPKGERHWDELEPVLKSLTAAAPDSIEAVLLRAEVLAAQSQIAEARELLQSYDIRKSPDVRWWIALINLALREGDLDGAQQLLHEAQREMGRHVELALMEARLAVYRGDSGLERLAEIARDRSGWSDVDRARVLYDLAALYVTLGQSSEAEKLWKEISEITPFDLRVWLYRFDAAIAGEDFDACRDIIDAMRRIEGPNGSYTQLAEAFLILRSAMAGGDTSRLTAARATLTSLQVRRPRWARVPWALALLDEMDGRREHAAENYLRAFDLGDRRPELVRRTLDLLHALHRYDLAEDLIKRWEQLPNAPILPEINRMAAEISLERQEPQQALMRALRAVSKNSANFQDHLWLAQILRASGDMEEAEEEFRTAVQLAPETGETWVALIRHLLRQDRKEEADAVLERIAGEVPSDQQAAVRAVCLETLGNHLEAETEYRRAVDQSPRDPRLLSEAAEFFRRQKKLADAERLWRQLIEVTASGTTVERCAARRGLATTLAFRGDYPAFREALSLAERNLKELPNSALDLRAKATLLAMRGDPRQRREAIQLFNKLGNEEPLTDQDQALLAAMQEINGDLAKAHELWQVLVAANTSNRFYLARYISVLLRRQAMSDAKIWLERLRALAPDWQPTLELQAEYLLHEGRAQDAVRLFAQHVGEVKDESTRARRLVEAAEALERLAETFLRSDDDGRELLLKSAEGFFRDHAMLHPDKPQVLAGFLLRTGRVPEAFELFERAWDAAPPALVSSILAASLTKADVDSQVLSRAADAIVRHFPTPPAASMLNDLAAVAELRQDFDQAEAHYREALRIAPDHVAALNNLAFLLALQHRNVSEAAQLTEKAFALAGPSPPLLDTRAQVAIAEGNLDAARIDREAVANEAPSAAAWFRLAIVYHQLKDQRKQREAAEKARRAGLVPRDLHLLERRYIDVILKTLNEGT
jgi:tetratricopeptide (TPR) repeat protein